MTQDIYSVTDEQVASAPKSKGHYFMYGPIEYFYGPDGNVYSAAITYPLAVNGYRLGARFECYASMAAYCKARLVN